MNYYYTVCLLCHCKWTILMIIDWQQGIFEEKKQKVVIFFLFLTVESSILVHSFMNTDL